MLAFSFTHVRARAGKDLSKHFSELAHIVHMSLIKKVKYSFSLVAMLLMLSPLTAFAQTDTLTALQQQIAALQQQLISLQGKQSGGGGGLGQSLSTNKPLPANFSLPPGDIEEVEITPIVSFDRNLYLGLRNDPDVSNLQEFLTDQGFYNQTISGNFFILTRNAVKKFQAAHGIRPSGYFGPLTRTVANKILAGEVSPPTIPPLMNRPPVISGIKGPTTLKVNETGTWTIQASDPEKGSLAYHVTWGDEEVGIPRPPQKPVTAEQITQTATLTHTYAKAGTFSPLFVVVDDANLSAQTSIGVLVNSVSRPPSIKVLSPNGGETLVRGQQIPIAWTGGDPKQARGVSFQLLRSNGDFVGYISCGNASSGSFNFGNPLSLKFSCDSDYTTNVVPNGAYLIKAVDYNGDTGLRNEDQSDAPFSIEETGTTSAQASITVTSPNSGEAWQVGNTYSVRWSSNGAPGTKTIHAIGLINGVAVDKYLGNSDGDSFNYTVSSVITPPGNWTLWVCGRFCPKDGGFGDGRAITITSGSPTTTTDLRVTGITKESLHPYGFNATFCVDGSQSTNDLKKMNPSLTDFPFDYAVYDLQGKKHQRRVGAGGTPEDLKNGQCLTFGWIIQQQEQDYYNQSKKVELILDPANLIAETNESNNSLIFAKTPSAIQVLLPNGGEVWNIGTTQIIKWTGGSGTTGIYLYRETPNAACGFCNFISIIASGVSADQGQYAWTIPNTLTPGSTFYIRLSGGASADNSDAPFSIVQP